MPKDIDQAILELLADERYATHLYNTYVGTDVQECAHRFAVSGEFAEVIVQVGLHAQGTILDLGAGNGIASYAFAQSGADLIFALEPGDSKLVGRGAIQQVTDGLPVRILDGVGEAIPLPDESVDLVYARQVLHHTRDLAQVMHECRRVLKPGGLFLACREHVVDSPAQLQTFLANHPIHQKVGGENAHPLHVYCKAIEGAGLQLRTVWGPWDSVINAFPGVKAQAELADYPQQLLHQRSGVSWGNARLTAANAVDNLALAESLCGGAVVLFSGDEAVSVLNICIDARLASGHLGGVEQTIVGLAHGFSQLDGDDEIYHFLVHNSADDWLLPHLQGSCRPLYTGQRVDVETSTAWRSTMRSWLRRGWHAVAPMLGERLVPIPVSDGIIERAGIEVMHFATPLAFLTAVPSLYQFFDVQHRVLPENFSAYERLARDVQYRRFMTQARVISAMTSHGKADLLRHYPAAVADKAVVVPFGPALTAYQPLASGTVEAMARQLTLPERYLFLSSSDVETQEPHHPATRAGRIAR